MDTYKERVDALRGLMRERGAAVYLVPHTDPHQSEYAPSAWERVAWLSGFTGSHGDLAIGLGRAGLWTDSRYFLQAESQLAGSGIDLYRLQTSGVPSLETWAAEEAGEDGVIAADPALISRGEAQSLRDTAAARGARVEWIDENLVDLLWKDRPPLPASPVESHPTQYAGASAEEKVGQLRARMEERGADAHVLVALDSIAWLLNLRGSDVPYNPLVVAYLAVSKDRLVLWIDRSRVPAETAQALPAGTELRPYEAFSEDVAELAGSWPRVWLDPQKASVSVANSVSAAGSRILWSTSPVPLLKAVKNPTEIAGFRAAHVRDGAAMVRFLRWLEREAPGGGLTERGAADALERIRAEDPLFRGLSFRTISGYGEHGAIVHYSVTEESDVPLRPEGLYLVDSGAQYLDGTTDITRTVALGPVSDEQRERFTQVLRAHISIATARFPRGTRGVQLDALARRPLWDAGLNYGHGTGHGIGSYLCVHEGPQSLSPVSGVRQELLPGMFVSLEPGFYADGQYGIRTENLAVVAQDPDLCTETSVFYRFEVVTLCPIDRSLILPDLMSPAERGYVDSYHDRVRRTLRPHLDAEHADWLEQKTAPL